MQSKINQEDSKKLFKAIVSFDFFLFILYAICILFTGVLVFFSVDYLMSVLFSVDIVGIMVDSRCYWQAGGWSVCPAYKLIFKVMNSHYWPFLAVPIIGSVVGNRILNKIKQ